MSSEVCPFCGKTYKRLKSHLPHCKAAGSSKAPPAKRDVAANQTPSSSQLAAASSQAKAGEEKSTQTLPVTASPQSKKSTKIPSVSSVAPSTPPSSVLASSPTKKKKKEKLSEQIKAAKIVSSTSLGASPSPSPPSNVSEPKRKSLRALIEAAKSKQVSEGSGEGTRSAPEDLPSASAPLGTDSLNSLNVQTETKTSLDKALGQDTSHPVFLSKGSKPEGASKMKATRTKNAIPSPLPINETSPDSEVNDRTAKSRLRGGFWVTTDVGGTDLPVSEMFSKPEGRITLQDVKATLGRAKNRPYNRPSILSQIRTDDLSGEIRPALPTGNEESNLVSTQTPPNELSSNSSRSAERQSAPGKSSKSKEATLTPLQHHVSPQPGLPEASVLSGYLSSQVNKATPPPPAVRVNEALKAGQRHAGLLCQPPSLAHALRLPPQALPAREEMLRFGDGSQLEVRRQKNTAGNGAKGALTERGLGQVRLRELPEWLACKTPSHPRDVVHMVRRGWQWYYKRYIDVRKGGVGGVGMLLAGYCVLSYIWSYPHIKRDRWRKHH